MQRKILLEATTLVMVSEAALRVILGWRMLVSGISNVRRWPNPVNTASILFPKGTAFFGFAATFLMAALYFAVRGSAAFGVDNWLPNWVIWLF